MCKLRCDGKLNTWTRYARCLTSYELRHETKINSRKYLWIRLSDLENVLIHLSMPLCKFIASAIVSQFIVCWFFVFSVEFRTHQSGQRCKCFANRDTTEIEMRLNGSKLDEFMHERTQRWSGENYYYLWTNRSARNSFIANMYSLQRTVCAFQRNMKSFRRDVFHGLIRWDWNDFDTTNLRFQEKEKWPDRDIPMHTVWTGAMKVSILLRSIHSVSRCEFRWFPWRHMSGAIDAHVLHFQCYFHHRHSPLSIAANSTVCNLFRDNVADKLVLFN